MLDIVDIRRDDLRSVGRDADFSKEESEAFSLIASSKANMLDMKKDLKYNFEKEMAKASQGQPYSAAYVSDCYFWGWGVEKNFDLYLKYLKKAAELGNGRSCIQMFFIDLKSGRSDRAISWLDRYKENDGIDMPFCIGALREHMRAWNDQLTAEELLATFDENEDAYIVALCNLFGYGCRVDPVKASELLVRFVQWQLQKYSVETVLVGFYPTQVLLWNCIMLLDHENNKELYIKIQCLLGFVSCKGKYLGAEDKDIINKPCDRAGYYDLSVINFCAIPEFMKNLCESYCLELADNSKIKYPTYRDIIDEAVALNEKGVDVENIFFLIGLSDNKKYQKRSGELLIDFGYETSGYRILADLYIQRRKHREAAKYLSLLANQESTDKSYLNSAERYVLGYYYFCGRGVKRDADKCYECWMKAAQNGDEKAEEMVRRISDLGNGDFKKGFKSFKWIV